MPRPQVIAAAGPLELDSEGIVRLGSLVVGRADDEPGYRLSDAGWRRWGELADAWREHLAEGEAEREERARHYRSAAGI